MSCQGGCGTRRLAVCLSGILPSQTRGWWWGSMHWRGRSTWYNPRIFRILHIRLLQISRHRNPYLQGHIGRIFPTRNALLDVRWDHPWHCQVSFASPFAENLTLPGIVDLSLGTMIWTFASESRSLRKPLFDLQLSTQDEHLLEKGQVAKTLEVMGCRVARAKEYSWKVRKWKF